LPQPDKEQRIIAHLTEIAQRSPDDDIMASSVSADTGISAADARDVLRDLSLKGYLVPRVEMRCSTCGTPHDEEASQTSDERFCLTCGDNQRHDPTIVFSIGKKFKKRLPREGANTGKKRLPRVIPPLLTRGGLRLPLVGRHRIV